MPTPITAIRPEDIDASRTFWEAFGSIEADAVAAAVVEFCQRRGKGWEPISLPRFEEYIASRRLTAAFRRFMEARHLASRGDELYVPTEFVLRCHGIASRR